MSENFVESLPYEKGALEPYISRDTVYEHYEKHHKGYFTKLQAKFPQFTSLQEALEANNNLAKQIFNHNFYWKCLSPNGGRKTFDESKYNISYDELISKMIESAMGHFGSGWIWVISNKSNNIKVCSTLNGDLPTLEDGESVLVCNDIWEHAFYIDYRSNKKDYIEKSSEYLLNFNVSPSEIEKKVLNIR